MSFELLIPTEAKLTDYDVLSDKDREPDTNPGAAMSFHMTVSNEHLSMFDGFLRGMIFCKAASPAAGDQQSIVTDLPDLTAIGKALGEFSWDQELTGYSLTFDYGLAGGSNIVIPDCKLAGFRFQGKQGGSTVIKVKVEAPDVPEKVHGRLAFLKRQSVKIILTAPEVEDSQADVEDVVQKPRRGSKQTPEQALAAQLGQDSLQH